MFTFHIRPHLTNRQLNELFAAAWPGHETRDFAPVLCHSLTYVTVQAPTPDATLLGFVNVAWDGGIHAFLLDLTVHPARQRQGIGRALVQHALDATRCAAVSPAIRWLHVDYEPHLAEFYGACGFRATHAGLIAL